LALLLCNVSQPLASSQLEDDYHQPTMPIVIAQYADPSMTVKGNMRPHNTVEYAVGKLRTDVAKRVTKNFQLEPKLEPTMLEAKIFPSSEVLYGHFLNLGNDSLYFVLGLIGSDRLSVIPEDISLTVLFEPDEDHKDLLKTNMSEMKSGRSLLIFLKKC
jgi:hypothetical protein